MPNHHAAAAHTHVQYSLNFAALFFTLSSFPAWENFMSPLGWIVRSLSILWLYIHTTRGRAPCIIESLVTSFSTVALVKTQFGKVIRVFLSKCPVGSTRHTIGVFCTPSCETQGGFQREALDPIYINSCESYDALLVCITVVVGLLGLVQQLSLQQNA